jgi:hypothetical protein
MDTAEGSAPPPGAVVRTKPPMLFPLVRGGKVELGQERRLSDEAIEAILVIAVAAATEAAAESIRIFLEGKPGGLSPEEKRLHEDIVKVLQQAARNPEVARAAIHAASRWANERGDLPVIVKP